MGPTPTAVVDARDTSETVLVYGHIFFLSTSTSVLEYFACLLASLLLLTLNTKIHPFVNHKKGFHMMSTLRPNRQWGKKAPGRRSLNGALGCVSCSFVFPIMVVHAYGDLIYATVC